MLLLVDLAEALLEITSLVKLGHAPSILLPPSLCCTCSCKCCQRVQRLCTQMFAGVDYGSRNVLADPDLRSGIKEFSSWPTVPQVGHAAVQQSCVPCGVCEA